MTVGTMGRSLPASGRVQRPYRGPTAGGSGEGKAEGRTTGRQHSESTWSSSGRTRMESADNGGSGQRGNEKAVKIIVLWKRCGIVLRSRILPKVDGRRTLSPLPTILRIRGFDTGRGLGVNSAGPQDLGGGYLLLLHLVLFLYSYSYKV